MNVHRRGKLTAALMGAIAIPILLVVAWNAKEPIAMKLGLRDLFIRRALERTRLTFKFDGRSLAEVLRYMENALNVRFTVDPGIPIEEVIVDLSARNQKAVDTLSQIMTMTNLDYEVSVGIIRIFERRLAKDSPYVIRDVGEMLGRIRDFAPKTDP